MSEWVDYYRAMENRQPRQLFQYWQRIWEASREKPGFAIDLGCGDGTETLALLAHGWSVLAVDSTPEAIEWVIRRAPEEDRDRLQVQVITFQLARFPPANLIYAGLSLPFCSPEDFLLVWRKICTALKPGGQVVYSTCTLAPEEDEAVLDEILRRFPNAVEVEGLESRLSAPAPALAQAYGQEFDPQVVRAARLWPHRFHTSGFFAALIRKTAAVDFPSDAPPYRPLALVGQKPLTGAAKRDVHLLFEQQFGLPLGLTLSEYRLELWHSPAGIFAVPTAYLEQFSGLPCQLLGLKLAEESPEGLIPAHDWVARFGSGFTNGKVEIPAEMVSLWLRGEDLVYAPPDSQQNGVVVLIDPDNRILGRGRMQADRIKNLLPRRLI